MKNKQKKMLKALDTIVENCEECSLHSNGKAVPYWTNDSKYIIVGEAPGKNEVVNNIPFVGTAGKHLWGIMGEYGFRREDFLVINTCQCRPVIPPDRNGKPTQKQIDKCQRIVKGYFKVLKPPKIILLGNYAIGSILGESGIMERNGLLTTESIFDMDIMVVRSVHPAMCIYKGIEGQKMLKKSIKNFVGV